MSDSSVWLPSLILLEQSNGDWGKYLDTIYSVFRRDFVDSKPNFQGRRVGLKRHPLADGKEATFWHFISTGKGEDQRTPDLRRCERISWPRPIMEAVGNGKIRIWENLRDGEKRIVIALPDFSYVVVVADRGAYVLPWTAYVVVREHQKQKLRREYKAYKSGQKS